MGFPKQEYSSGLPFPPPRDLSNTGTEPASPVLAGRVFTTDLSTWEAPFKCIQFSQFSLVTQSCLTLCDPIQSMKPRYPALQGDSLPAEPQGKPTVQETGVQSPGREDPLENVMETHSSVLAWEIPWTEEPGGLQSTQLQSQMQLGQQTTTIIVVTGSGGRSQALESVLSVI